MLRTIVRDKRKGGCGEPGTRAPHPRERTYWIAMPPLVTGPVML